MKSVYHVAGEIALLLLCSPLGKMLKNVKAVITKRVKHSIKADRGKFSFRRAHPMVTCRHCSCQGFDVVAASRNKEH